MALNITDVRIYLSQKDDGNLKAFASITIDDCFVVHDIKILEGNDELYVKMPRRQGKNGEFIDIAHPINTETRTELKNIVLAKYDEELKKNK